MNTATKKLGIGLLAFLLTAMTGMSARADDTEIFFGGASNASINPNILFILDTSGSMSSKDGYPESRLDRMKSAFKTLMNSLNNVNVGLMRYNDPGGPILYPVSNIDAQVSTTTFSGTDTESIGTGEDDAEQSSTGAVTLNNPSLAITTRTSVGASTSTSLQVSASADDAEETLSDHTMQLNASQSLETPFDDTQTADNTSDEQAIGMIFRNAGIPHNATILSATLQFRILYRRETQQCYGWGWWQTCTNVAAGQYADPLDLSITGQTGGNINDFNNQNIYSRPKTTARALWQITDPSPPAGSTVNSSDISTVIQEMVNQSSWDTSSDLALFMQRPAGGTKIGTRDLYSFDGASAYAPTLNVTYEVATSGDVQTVGLRFATVRIPQGATVTSASLSFTAASNDSATTAFNIYGEAADDSNAFTTTSGDLNRTLTSAAAAWTPGAWTKGTVYNTSNDGVDLTSVVQEIVNRTGWCGGNAMTFIITGSGTRYASSYEDSPSAAPILNVTYDPNSVPSTGGCMASTLSYRINTSSDDAEEVVSGWNSGSQSTNSGVLNIGYNGSEQQVVGLRFNGIQLPKNANISSAYIEFTSYDNQSNSADYTIYAEDADNPSTYSSGRKAASLSTLSSTVSWNAVPSWSSGGIYRTPDLKSLVQSLVNRSGWSNGNAMNFIIKLAGSSSGTRDAYSFDGKQALAPRLVIVASTSGGGVIGDTTRTKLIETVDSLQPGGYTPIVDTFYEAARYYRGDSVYWGAERGDPNLMRSSNYDRLYFRLSNAKSYTGGSVYLPSGCTSVDANSSSCVDEKILNTPTTPIYKSPIVNQCQSNYIVLLTDGEPTQNQSVNLIKQMTGVTSCQTSGYGACGQELINFLHTKDQSTTLPNDQTIKTYTIGFNINDPYLSDIAKNGGGKYYTASSSSDLLSAFNDIVGGILSQDTTFVSPGVTVNSFNRLTHRNEIYFALFKPKQTPNWPGNLKRYKVTSSGEIDDANGVAAVDPNTGFFKDTAQSYWSASVDGNKTELGGAASNLPDYSTRNVYTYYSGSTSTTLSSPVNSFSDSNTNITNSMLGIGSATATYRSNLINWARGEDILDANGNGITAENRDQLNDPLHSIPYLVTYGGTNTNPDIAIFYGDNSGFLHAINAATGVEYFSFIPEELLPHLDTLYQNAASDPHPYGIDGPVMAWVKDNNGDSTIDATAGDHVYVYFGMRRGGRNYYAIDATDRSNPKMLWTITGGSTDFADLGQTWSRPVKTKVRIYDSTTNAYVTKDVLIFAGGYDPHQDSVTTISTDTMGNAIYMVDASTGALIWKAGDNSTDTLKLSDMKYSIPGDIRAVDINNDGLADQLYVGDTGGQLWRFDINNGATTSNLVTGGVIADVSGTTAADARRFYHAPDISLNIENGVRKLYIAIGSGYQAHPLSTDTTDRFYVFKQTNISAPPPDTNGDGVPDYVKMTESDLYDATADLITTGTSAQQSTALTDLAAADGWYITLSHAGEKVLSTSLTYNGTIYFTTYEPKANTVSCVPSAGTSRLYALNILNATAIDTNRYTELKNIGLPPDPVHIRVIGPTTIDPNNPNGGSSSSNSATSDVLCVGTICSKIGSGSSIIKTYWYNQ